MKKISFILCLLVSVTHAQSDITKIEYWIGSDPGFGSATFVTGITPQPDISGFMQTITPNLSQGINYIGYRSIDDSGKWSHTNFLTVYAVDAQPSQVAKVEYFWDNDPGFNNAVDSIYSNPVADVSNGLLYANVLPLLELGEHILLVRSKDTKGRWSHTNYVEAINVEPVSVSELEEAGVAIFPNPFSNEISISASNNEPLRFILYDINGKKLMDKLVSGQSVIPTTELPTGTYTSMIWKKQKTVYRTVLIKQ